MTMTTIDWEKLGDAACDGADCQSPCECSFDGAARAVVAALGDQGLVVVRREDAQRTRRWYGWAVSKDATTQEDDDARARIVAAITGDVR